MSTSVANTELQVAVQQKLGRFLLQVQRYEMLLKALVIDSKACGTAETAPLHLERRKPQFGAKPMAPLVDELNKSFRLEGATIPEVDTAPTVIGGKPGFQSRFTLELPADELVRTQARLEAFRTLRNRIVHHLLEDHDLAAQEGCERAIVLLDESFEAAKAAFDEVRQWANTALEAREHFARFVRTAEFQDALIHGILPDGTVHWPTCTAVRLLRRAEQGTPPGEMTRLDAAVKEIKATHPDHKPERYFCKNWKELLARSRQFEIRKVKGSTEQRGITWYRSLAEGPTLTVSTGSSAL